MEVTANIPKKDTQWLSSLKATFHQAVHFFYGTKARTNYTLLTLFGSILLLKLIETYAIAPYCSI